MHTSPSDILILGEVLFDEAPVFFIEFVTLGEEVREGFFEELNAVPTRADLPMDREVAVKVRERRGVEDRVGRVSAPALDMMEAVCMVSSAVPAGVVKDKPSSDFFFVEVMGHISF